MWGPGARSRGLTSVQTPHVCWAGKTPNVVVCSYLGAADSKLFSTQFIGTRLILIDNLWIYGARSNNKILFTHYWNPPEEEERSQVIDEQDKSGGI